MFPDETERGHKKPDNNIERKEGGRSHQGNRNNKGDRRDGGHGRDQQPSRKSNDRPPKKRE